MPTLQKLYPTLLGELALEPRDKNAAFGRRGGFPLGLRVTDAKGKGTVVLHARFPKQSEALQRAQLTFDHMLQRLMHEKLAEVTIEKDTAYLSLRKVADRIERHEAVPAIDEFIAGLARAGVSAGEACHYCESTEDVNTIFNGDRVGQICRACTTQQAKALLEERRFDPNSLPKLLLLAAVVIPLLAAEWAAAWWGVDAFFRSQGGQVKLPVKLALICAFLFGVAGASPLLLFRRVPNRGDRRAGILGVSCALIAFALGEVGVATAFVWKVLGLFSLKAGVLVAVRLLTGGNGLFLLLRGTALASFLGFAFKFAKPPKAKLKL